MIRNYPANFVSLHQRKDLLHSVTAQNDRPSRDEIKSIATNTVIPG